MKSTGSLKEAKNRWHLFWFRQLLHDYWRQGIKPPGWDEAHSAVRWDRDSYLTIRVTVAPFRHGGGRHGRRLWPKHTPNGKGMTKSALIPQTNGCAAEIISYAIILYVKVQSSVTEYRCPFPQTQKGKTNGRHHSFECFYTAIPTSCCKKTPKHSGPSSCVWSPETG